MRRLVAALGLVCALSALTGCKWVYVGDSVLWGAGGLLDSARDEDKLDPVIGRGPESPGLGKTTLRQAIVAAIPDVDPGGWLVVQEAGDHVIDAAFVQWVVDTVPDDRCLAWVTPHDWMGRSVAADVATIEAGIVQQPCHQVVPWHAVDTSQLTTDTLHLTPAGNEALVHIILENT